MPLTPKDQTVKLRPSLLKRKKHLTIAREENKHMELALDPETRLQSQRSRLSSQKPTLKDRYQIKGLYI